MQMERLPRLCVRLSGASYAMNLLLWLTYCPKRLSDLRHASFPEAAQEEWWWYVVYLLVVGATGLAALLYADAIAERLVPRSRTRSAAQDLPEQPSVEAIATGLVRLFALCQGVGVLQELTFAHHYAHAAFSPHASGTAVTSFVCFLVRTGLLAVCGMACARYARSIARLFAADLPARLTIPETQ